MATVNLTEVNSVLLELVDPNIQKVFNESDVLYNRFGRGSASDVNNRGVRLVSYVRPNPQQGYYDEGGLLVEGGTTRRIQMNVKYVRYNRSVILTRDAIENTKAHSLLNALRSHMETEAKSAITEFNRQLYGSGTCALATVADVTNAATGRIVFSAPTGVQWLLNEGVYDIISSGGTNKGTIFLVPGTISRTNLRADFSLTVGATSAGDISSTSIAATDILVWKGSYNKGFKGLGYHVNNDTGAYQSPGAGFPSITRAAYPELKATVIDASSAALSTSLMQRTLTSTLFKVDGGVRRGTKGFFILSNPGQCDAYRNLGYDLRRITDNEGTLDLGVGYQRMSFNGIEWLADTDCPGDTMYFLRSDTIKRYELYPLKMLEFGGQTLMPVPGFTSGSGAYYDRFTFYMGAMFDYGSTEPNANAKIVNLSTTNLPTGNLD